MSAEIRTMVHAMRAEFNLEEFDLDLLGVIERLNTQVEELREHLLLLEAQIEKTRSAAAHANNIASCLANGIQPD